MLFEQTKIAYNRNQKQNNNKKLEEKNTENELQQSNMLNNKYTHTHNSKNNFNFFFGFFIETERKNLEKQNKIHKNVLFKWLLF